MPEVQFWILVLLLLTLEPLILLPALVTNLGN